MLRTKCNDVVPQRGCDQAGLALAQVKTLALKLAVTPPGALREGSTGLQWTHPERDSHDSEKGPPAGP